MRRITRFKIYKAIYEWSYRKVRKQYNYDYDRNQMLNRRRKKYNGIQVSDHALLRYFERMEGYDLDEVAKNITLGVKPKEALSKQVTADMQVVCEDNVVLTLYRKEYTGGNRIKGL